MVDGNGDIASVLIDREDFIFFARGVSNSQCIDKKQFERERLAILKHTDTDKHFVYFSSLSVYTHDTPYTRHKETMEELIKQTFKLYTIIRIGNITWGNNQNTIINFIKNKIKNNESFTIRDEYKFICTFEELMFWLDLIPHWSGEMNIPGKTIHMNELVNDIKTGHYD